MDDKILDTYIKPKNSKVSIFFTKILVSIIIFLIFLILIKFDDSYKKYLDKYLINNNLNFNEFKNFYDKFSLKSEAATVFSLANGIEYTNTYISGDMQVLEISPGTIIKSLEPGIVVFKGSKEGFNNTVIVQGSDGFDIWYGNLNDISVSIYDYIDANTILGSSDKMYLKITKDGQSFTYEEYQNK